MKHGFIKVAAAAPEIRVADPMFNADAVIRAMDEHARLGVKVLVFPELTLTGATCGDLFYQNTLLAGAAAALEKVVKASEGKDMLVFVGLPVAQGAKVYDAAAAVCNGELLGVVPASCPGDKHFALPGAQIARWLGPVGGIFVLLLSALMVVFCFTAGANPVPGYTPPHDSTYYAEHLDELAQELNANFLPVLDETAHAEADGGTVTVTASAKEYVPVRGAVLKFYDAALFTFEKAN